MPWSWGATDQEIAADYPCSGRLSGPVIALHRAIDVAASAEVTFRWLCQLKHGTYSYRLLGGGPRVLTPGADELALGQQLMIFQLVDFLPGEHLTGEIQPELVSRYGALTCTYAVRPTGDSSCRIVVRIEIAVPTPARRLSALALAWGDLVMMRKQLRVLRQLAESS
ncbi:SRPBCC family protein [Kribbella antibiotica]|uniref:SRPBCC family protein n=2 Tax=Kribbella antibiotica TaxID=190195 RepID=A0A4R4ZI76_9ACTN|nr:SRPBCC family protein [Kribbella antibiotica]